MAGLMVKARDIIKDKWETLRVSRLRRRRVLSSVIARWLPQIRALLYGVGVLWIFLLPSGLLGRGIYIDENALQPGQVNTYWDWAEAHQADLYLSQLETLGDKNASSVERAEFLKMEFKKLGVYATTQSYRFLTNSDSIIAGVNTYAVLAAPRASGTEAMVLSASWKSRLELELELDGEQQRQRLNLRGIATLLSLASYLRRYSHWARDIIFVIGDDHLPGMHAWLSAYHNDVQSNLEAQPLNITSSVIWTALNIDYPDHSFSHLGVFHEGLNGRLPNLDLYSSINYIATRVAGVPTALYDDDNTDSDGDGDGDRDVNEGLFFSVLAWLRSAAMTAAVPGCQEYLKRAKALGRHAYYQGFGRGSGVHGLYHRYRIDAVTIFAIPADGPHGFHSMGRVIESTLRTMNNLLERLHASLFFYILTGPLTILKIGHYLPTVILISVATLFGGLQTWVNAGWRKWNHHAGEIEDKKEEEWEPRRRPVTKVLLIILATHTIGALLFLLAWKWGVFQDGFIQFDLKLTSILLAGVAFQAFATISDRIKSWIISPSRAGSTDDDAPFAEVLVAFNLCLTSTLISVTSVLNFSLAVLLGIFLALPLSLFPPRTFDSQGARKVKQVVFFTLAVYGLNLALNRRTLWDWMVLGNGFAPLVCIVYAPLLLQMAVACSLF